MREGYTNLLDGRSIYYTEEGSGRPLVYVHASADDADGARGMFDALHGEFHCIALDRTGNGRSAILDRTTTIEEQVEAIACAHSACSDEPAWVFGHSAGGNWAIAYALYHPERVAGLVLMEPALYAAVPPARRSAAATTMIDTVGPLFGSGRLKEAGTTFMGLIAPERTQDDIEEFVTTGLGSERRARWESMASEQPLVVTWSPDSADWARLDVPALVVEGDQTGEVLRTVAAEVAGLLPNGRLLTLEGANHAAPRNEPQAMADAIISFTTT